MLLHHAGSTHREFENIAPGLARHFRVIAPDLPGHGNTAPIRPPVSMGDYAKFVVELMDGLGVRSAHVAGIHTGGEIAAKMAIQYPDRVDSIAVYGVLCRSQEKLDALLNPDVLEAAPIRDDGSHLLEAWNFQKLFVQQGEDPRFVHALVVEQLLAGENETLAHVACYHQNREARQELPRIRCPALVITGSRDPLHEDSANVAKLIPNCGYLVIEGADVHVTRQHASTYTDAIVHFIENQRRAT
jgi:pimeloyl-ACP methyl ester carboxylesterase